MKVMYDEKNDKWIQLENGSPEGYYIDGLLFKKLMLVRGMRKKGYDAIFQIVGAEGSGKSTLGLLCGWVVSGEKLTINNIAETSEDAIDKLDKLPDGSVLIIDEGSLMFSSKDTMTKEQRQLEKILNVCRQKGMTVIIIAPVFFSLSKYICVHRSRFLLRVYTDSKLNRGRFAYYGEKKKKMLYILGKKNFESYAKPKPNFRGRFVDFQVPFHEEYLKTKRRTMMAALKTNVLNPQQLKWKVESDMLWNIIKSKSGITLKDIAKMTGKAYSTIKRCNKEHKALLPRENKV